MSINISNFPPVSTLLVFNLTFLTLLLLSTKTDFSFVKDVGLSFYKIVPHIINKRKDDNWTEEEKNKQLLKRGRYVEFNLLWDRGTQFGIKTGGNTDAILMSMPPDARWE